MTATDELRRLLDERGVEYETDDAQVSDTEWYYVTKLRDGYHDRWIYEEPPDCDLLVSYQYDLGAEDAIAATLGDTDATPTRQGVGTCHDRGNIERFICSECGCRLDLQDDDWEATMWLDDGTAMVPRFCPNCGRRVVE